jgi:hypothetical protein
LDDVYAKQHRAAGHKSPMDKLQLPDRVMDYFVVVGIPVCGKTPADTAKCSMKRSPRRRNARFRRCRAACVSDRSTQLLTLLTPLSAADVTPHSATDTVTPGKDLSQVCVGKVLDRFPLTDYDDCPLPSGIPLVSECMSV